MNLLPNIPKDLSDLLKAMADDFFAILRKNLIGLYLWGSLTYDAFDATCSDVDLVAVTQRDLDAREFFRARCLVYEQESAKSLGRTN